MSSASIQSFRYAQSMLYCGLRPFSVVTVIETGTDTAVLCLCIDGSVLKWSSSGVLNVNSRLQVVSPTRLAGGCYRWDQR